jgi:hypothetical protein
MLSDQSLRSVLDALAQEASEDIVGIWVVEGFVRENTRQTDGAIVKAVTLVVIEQALEDGLVRVGSFDGSTIHFWDDPPDVAVARIELLWMKKGAAPGMEDNVWLASPTLHYRKISRYLS